MSRLIDADKLIDEIESYHGDIFASEIVELIKQMPSVDVPDINVWEWIPCSERMPEEPEINPVLEGKNLEIYLVTTDFGSNEQDKVYPFRAFWNGVNFTDGWNILDVVAWMPIPEPYNPEGEKL